MSCSLLLTKICVLFQATCKFLLGKSPTEQIERSPAEAEHPLLGHTQKISASEVRDGCDDLIRECSDLPPEPSSHQNEESSSDDPGDESSTQEEDFSSGDPEDASPNHQGVPAVCPRLNRGIADVDHPSASVTSESHTPGAEEVLPRDQNEILASERREGCSPGLMLAEIAKRDLRKTVPLLSHVIQTPGGAEESIDVPDSQEAVLVVRMAVFDIMLAELLKGDDESLQQLVLFAPGVEARFIERQSLPSPLTVFAVNDAAIAKDCERYARHLQPVLPDGVDYIHVQAVLEGWVWDSGLVLHGYNWQLPSVWVMQLDVTNIPEQSLERHFRMIGSLASSGSLILLVYVTPVFNEKVVTNSHAWKGNPPSFSCADPFEFAKKCGFQLEFAISLRDAAMKYAFPDDLRSKLGSSAFSEGVRFAIFGHMEQNESVVSPMGDVMSEVTAYSTVSGNAGLSSVPSGMIETEAPTLTQTANHSSIGDFEDYMNGDHRVIRFEVNVLTLPMHLALAEYSMVLIGSESSVGCWDPKRAKKMDGRICEEGGRLKTKLLLSVHACDVEYKYAVTNARQEIVAWEAGSNRKLEWPSDEELAEPGFVQFVSDVWHCE